MNNVIVLLSDKKIPKSFLDLIIESLKIKKIIFVVRYIDDCLIKLYCHSDVFFIRSKFYQISLEKEIDVSVYVKRDYKLIAFDMDSTLLPIEVINVLAHENGTGDIVSSITSKEMSQGKDFTGSLEKRASYLKGLNYEKVKSLRESLPIRKGVDNLMRSLKNKGFIIAVISGGFINIAKVLKKKYNIDYIYANELEVKDNFLTGKVIGEVIDGVKKEFYLRKMANDNDIDINEVIAVGDGTNDIAMINTAGMGVAFHAKEQVKKKSYCSITWSGIDKILNFLD